MIYELPNDMKISKKEEKKIEGTIKVVLRFVLYFLLGYYGMGAIITLVRII